MPGPRTPLDAAASPAKPSVNRDGTIPDPAAAVSAPVAAAPAAGTPQPPQQDPQAFFQQFMSFLGPQLQGLFQQPQPQGAAVTLGQPAPPQPTPPTQPPPTPPPPGTSTPLPPPGAPPTPHPLPAGSANPYAPVDAASTFTPQQAIAYLESAIGQKLTPQMLQQAQQHIGWTGGNVTGAQMNSLLTEAAKYFPKGPAAPATGAAYWEELLKGRMGAPAPQLPTDPLPTYDPAQLYEGGNLGAIVEQILANPLSMSDQNVSALKEQNKEQQLDLMRQLRGEAGVGAASRGVFGGGYQQGVERDLSDRAAAEITRGNRAVDIQKMIQDQEDRYRAAGFGTDLRSRQADEGFRGFQTRVDAQNYALQRALAQAGLDQQSIDQALRAWQVATQNQLGEKGLGLDERRLSEQARQFDKGHNLDWIRVLNDMVMGRAGHGLDIAKLQQAAQQNSLSWLFPGGGGF